MLHIEVQTMLDGCCHGYESIVVEATSNTKLSRQLLAANALWLFCSFVKLSESPKSAILFNLDSSSRGSPPIDMSPSDVWRMYDVATIKLQAFVDTVNNRGDWESVVCDRIIHTVAAGLLLAALMDPSLAPTKMDPALLAFMRDRAIAAARERLQAAVHAELVKSKAEASLFVKFAEHVQASDPSTFLPTSLDVWAQARRLVSSGIRTNEAIPTAQTPLVAE